MLLAQHPVVMVVAGRNLERARTEFTVNVGIGDNGNLAPKHGNHGLFAYKARVTFVFGVHADGGVTGNGLGPGGGNGDMPAAVGQQIAHLPQFATALLVFHFIVGQGRVATRAPVDDVVALVDQAVVVEPHKNLAHSSGKAFVHGKAQARPVYGIAQGACLIENAVAVFVAPFPHPVNKSLAAKILAALAFLGQGAFHHVLGGNARMVGAGNPKHVLALLAGMTAKHVDKGMVERVPYVQRARDVGRRNDNGIRLAGGVRIGRKGFVILPVLAPPGFNVMGLIALG